MITTKHAGDVRAFVILSQAWYGGSSLPPKYESTGHDEITMGFYCPDGGTSGEFTIAWAPLGDRLVPRLKAFDDSWSALALFSDVVQKLAEIDGTNPSVEQVADILKSCGVVDKTERISPYSGQTLSDQEKVGVMAEVLNVHAQALKSLRSYGCKVSGNDMWAWRAEFGERVSPELGVPEDLYAEVVEKAGTVASRRAALAEVLRTLKDEALTERYAHLIVEQ